MHSPVIYFIRTCFFRLLSFPTTVSIVHLPSKYDITLSPIEIPFIFFNPEVVSNTGDIADLEEGCLSFPGIFVNIKRPTAIKARWQTSLGEVKEATLGGYECKCFLHELDHLEGIVFQDRVGAVKWALGVKKSKGNKKHVGR